MYAAKTAQIVYVRSGICTSSGSKVQGFFPDASDNLVTSGPSVNQCLYQSVPRQAEQGLATVITILLD